MDWWRAPGPVDNPSHTSLLSDHLAAGISNVSSSCPAAAVENFNVLGVSSVTYCSV
jgi:hypothetical protein